MIDAVAVKWTMRLVVFAGFLALAGAAQTVPTPGMSSAGQVGAHQNGANPTSAGSNSPFDPAQSPFPDTTKQKRNDERQRRLVIDTQKLVTLTALLKSEIVASGAESMTPEMLKQMDEIEKLARSVKDKMRD